MQVLPSNGGQVEQQGLFQCAGAHPWENSRDKACRLPVLSSAPKRLEFATYKGAGDGPMAFHNKALSRGEEFGFSVGVGEEDLALLQGYTKVGSVEGDKEACPHDLDCGFRRLNNKSLSWGEGGDTKTGCALHEQKVCVVHTFDQSVRGDNFSYHVRGETDFAPHPIDFEEVVFLRPRVGGTPGVAGRRCRGGE